MHQALLKDFQALLKNFQALLKDFQALLIVLEFQYSVGCHPLQDWGRE